MTSSSRSSLMARLVEIVTGFGAMVDVPELLQRITADAVDLLSAYAVGLVVRDGERLIIVAGTGAQPELVGTSFPLAGSAVEELLRSGRRSLSAAGDVYPHLNERMFRDSAPKPMAVSLTRTDSGTGALYVLRDEPLSLDEIEALELLAAHAGAALHTAQIFANEKELELAKDLFLATASHELRTPLTVLRGFAETLLNHWEALDDAGRRELVQTILARTEGMTGLVEQILLGSRAGIGVDVAVRPFDLAAAVRTAGAAIAGSSQDHPLVVEAPGSLLVLGDETTVDAILGQLVENAVKYSPAGGRIDVTLRADGPDAVLAVADLGMGIPPGDLTRVFQRFVRSEHVGGGRGTAGGAGLGLYIVKRYVEAQRGQVTALPRAGGGTVIEVRLPLA
jgi:signal transduction histidine kinase